MNETNQNDGAMIEERGGRWTWKPDPQFGIGHHEQEPLLYLQLVTTKKMTT